jgi:hypothetical protein
MEVVTMPPFWAMVLAKVKCFSWDNARKKTNPSKTAAFFFFATSIETKKTQMAPIKFPENPKRKGNYSTKLKFI